MISIRHENINFQNHHKVYKCAHENSVDDGNPFCGLIHQPISAFCIFFIVLLNEAIRIISKKKTPLIKPEPVRSNK